MPKCLFDRNTGLFVSGTRFDDVPHDPATHIQIELRGFPDRRGERWDGAQDVRPATAQEIADFETAEMEERARAELDDARMLKAIALWVAGKLSIPPAQARDEIKAIYKGL